MAKKRTASPRTTTKVVQVRAAAPIVVAAPRRAPARRRAAPARVTRHRSRSHASSGGGALTPSRLLGVGLGGAIYGYVEKTFPNLPTIPLIGKSGTIAVMSYFIAKQGGMGHSAIVKDVGIAAAVITGYSLGKTGKVSGDVDGAYEEV